MGNITETLNNLPVTSDIYELLSALNIRIAYNKHSKKDGYSYMGDIVLKVGLEPKYRLFVICHELGHALLHEKNGVFSYSNDVILVTEKEANTFACLLLKKFNCEDCIPNEMKHIIDK